MSGKLALVTGASGFIAGHVIDQLLQKGYRVRGTARGPKVESLRETINIPGLEFAQIDDIAKSDISEALKGVDVVFHVASPQPGKASVEDTLKGALDGTLNVLTQAEKAGIEKIVVTSSAGTVIDLTHNVKDWGKVPSDDEIHAQAESNRLFVYFCSKILAEKALDIATILPGIVIGPYAPHFPPPAKSNMGTNIHIYELINGNAPPASIPFIVDVRDVAKAHVLALELPRAAPEEKRFLLNVVDPATLPDVPPTLSKLDSTRSREVLKLEYTSPEKTLGDLIKDIAEVEKVWSVEA
ncbi:hypothetical protein BDQ17DRAFT_1365024 [Cyathus striatus]|nr:hypothetical protein BDQ17DRAFT_1365024 [Cyathus striatus]